MTSMVELVATLLGLVVNHTRSADEVMPRDRQDDMLRTGAMALLLEADAGEPTPLN